MKFNNLLFKENFQAILLQPGRHLAFGTPGLENPSELVQFWWPWISTWRPLHIHVSTPSPWPASLLCRDGTKPDLSWKLHCLIPLQQAPGNLCQILLSLPNPSPPSLGFLGSKLLNFTFGSQYPHAVQIVWGVCPCPSGTAHSHEELDRAQDFPQLEGGTGADGWQAASARDGRRHLGITTSAKGPKSPTSNKRHLPLWEEQMLRHEITSFP